MKRRELSKRAKMCSACLFEKDKDSKYNHDNLLKIRDVLKK